MKKVVVMVLAALLIGGMAGYTAYAKACEMNGGKCCGRCPLPPESK